MMVKMAQDAAKMPPQDVHTALEHLKHQNHPAQYITEYCTIIPTTTNKTYDY